MTMNFWKIRKRFLLLGFLGGFFVVGVVKKIILAVVQ